MKNFFATIHIQRSDMKPIILTTITRQVVHIYDHDTINRNKSLDLAQTWWNHLHAHI